MSSSWPVNTLRLTVETGRAGATVGGIGAWLPAVPVGTGTRGPVLCAVSCALGTGVGVNAAVGGGVGAAPVGIAVPRASAKRASIANRRRIIDRTGSQTAATRHS